MPFLIALGVLLLVVLIVVMGFIGYSQLSNRDRENARDSEVVTDASASAAETVSQFGP